MEDLMKQLFKVRFILVTLFLLSSLVESKDKSNLLEKVSKNPIVLLETNMGNIKIELYEEKAPISVKNFLRYVKSGFYNETIFHRVIDNFMIQGGGFTSAMKEKKNDKPIINEAKNKLSNKRGTIAMARTNVINSATSQFFINVNDNANLDYQNEAQYGYAVFGNVIEGMDIVDKIRKVKTGSKPPFDDVPETTVLIKSAKVVLK